MGSVHARKKLGVTHEFELSVKKQTWKKKKKKKKREVAKENLRFVFFSSGVYRGDPQIY